MRKLLFLSLTSFAFVHAKAQNSNVQDYINKYKATAINEMIRTGVPASITLAQGILESGSGQSKLAMYSNNHFGIKCKEEWTGDKTYHDDDRKHECFRVYRTPEESFKDHSDFLKNRPYYTELFDLEPTDYKGWAKGLKKAGYATERDYASNLIKLIEQNDLEEYSDEAIALMDKGQTYPESNTAIASISTPTNNTNSQASNVALFSDGEAMNNATKEKKTTIVANNNTIPSATIGSVTGQYPDGVFKINETSVIFAKNGSSLFAIATNNNISYGKLLAFNDLHTNVDILPSDRLIYLNKKPRKGSKEIHVVENGENLDMISQKEGIQIQYLAQYNHIKEADIPATGEKLYLQNVAPNSPRLNGNSSFASR
ncbi:glucosaminidase domain-containing protein [Rhizosphaericola mali]|uniref:Peptidoglycan hydrolase n=1 Tax=Rhizosphaericola mali TaxID=2545455 RepID=A0A5P2FXH2_9BACT|nr:glucosaminidase domain-containing protein [Rhizosphaericola mali]QES87895.1 LysM peptidoglycan-binding domain-containing protein [Rhizosphaericola mali]